MKTLPRIRESRPEDRPAIELCMNELQAFERSIEPNRVDSTKACAQYLDELEDECAKYSGTFLVAEMNDQVVGFVCVRARVPTRDVLEVDREYACITDVVVLESFRGAGIGVELLRAAESYVAARGATRIRIGVLAANAAAHRLYEKLGYRDTTIELEKQVSRPQG